MTLNQEILAQKQEEQDLIELGAVAAAATHIEELAAATEDGKLTVERIRVAAHKLNTILKIVDEQKRDVDYYAALCKKDEVQNEHNE